MEKDGNAGWVTISQDIGVVRETDKAIELRVDTDVFGRDVFVWVPRSCYREVQDGCFLHRQVRSWFYYRSERLRSGCERRNPGF